MGKEKLYSQTWLKFGNVKYVEFQALLEGRWHRIGNCMSLICFVFGGGDEKR